MTAAELPPPPVPADANLNGWGFMMIDAGRLQKSDFYALADSVAFHAAFNLWLVAWHRVPAVSLPNNDELLWRLAKSIPKLSTFMKHRALILRGWYLASDGNLYHPVLSEIAGKSWEARKKGQRRCIDKRIKDKGQIHAPNKSHAERVRNEFDAPTVSTNERVGKVSGTRSLPKNQQ